MQNENTETFTTESTSCNRLIPVTKWNEYHPWPPIGGLRYLIFHEKTNGFDSVTIRIGRTVLIDEEAFFAWARSKKGDA